MNWMLLPFKRYSDFDGRSRRKEYWMFTLGVIIVAVILSFIENIMGIGGVIFGLYGPLTTLFVLAIIIPGLAVQVRRFHDQDKSGWWVLLGIIPFGSLVVTVFMCLEGTRGDNSYGPDPKGQFDVTTFE